MSIENLSKNKFDVRVYKTYSSMDSFLVNWFAYEEYDSSKINKCRLQKGSVTKSLTSSWAYYTIPFEQEFESIPKVGIPAISTTRPAYYIRSITKSNFEIGFLGGSGNCTVNWIAFLE